MKKKAVLKGGSLLTLLFALAGAPCIFAQQDALTLDAAIKEAVSDLIKEAGSYLN
jgi:hypothetical protein